MRISDWSSDVCSSDLRTIGLVVVNSRFHNRTDPRARIPEACLLGLRFNDNNETGRASRRERVCQYVQISVGAVSLKKTKHIQATNARITTNHEIGLVAQVMMQNPHYQAPQINS